MAGAKYRELVSTAARMFSERGYENTSMRDLADEVGLKAGSLYSHIGGKEEVLWKLVSAVADRLVAAAAEASEYSGSARERLRLYLQRQFEVIRDDHHGVIILTFEWRSLDAEHKEQIKAMRDSAERYLDAILEGGMVSGEFALESVKWARLTVLSIGNWANQWYSADGAQSPEELAEAFVGVLATGLSPR